MAIGTGNCGDDGNRDGDDDDGEMGTFDMAIAIL